MKKLCDFSKIYVFSPSNAPTGGVELLHQLVDYLRKRNKDAYIYYYDNPQLGVLAAYTKYEVAVAEHVDDVEGNVAVLPEICFHLSKNYLHAQVVLWWLSVDNYYRNEKKHIPLSEIFCYSKGYALEELWHRTAGLFRFKWSFRNDFSIKFAVEKEYIHAYQSEYARLFLSARNVKNLYPLKDYINTELIADSISCERNPVVLYNPKKGLRFTRRLMKAAPDLTFVPLQNLSRTELQQLFVSSKLYIDFGNHPGMDRIPREAAVNGCCVITGRRGAAANDVDIPIGCWYKISEKDTPVQEIVERMKDVLADYEGHIKNFETYRQRILKEKDDFYRQIDALFGLH